MAILAVILGQTTILDLIVTSEVSGSLKGTINTAEGSSYKDRLMKDEDDTPCKFGGKFEIALQGRIQANGTYQFFKFTTKKAIYGKLLTECVTGISIECVTKADINSIYVEPEIKFEGLLLKVSASAGLSEYQEGDKIDDLKEREGLHYNAEGKLVVLDPYEWETGWKLPIMKF